MNIRRAVRRILNGKGDALIMAIVTITVLVLLGVSVITVSMGTLRTNRADAATNDAYYAAESGVSSGLDHLRQEVSRYYAQMMKAESGTYTSLFNNFAAGIAAGAQASFAEPDFAGGTTRTTFSVSGHDSSADVYEFLVSTVSTMADGTQYKVEGRLKVKRVDVSTKSWFSDLGALVVGKTLTVNPSSGITVNNGDAVLGALVHQVPWDYTVNNGKTIIDPSVKNYINDVLNYPYFSDPVIPNPKYYITSSTTMTASNYPWTNPVSVDTADGVSITITNNNIIPDGVIRVRGDLTIYNGGNVYSDIYCRNFTDYGRAYYGDIYCRGDFKKTGGDIYGNIYCDGDVTLSSISVQGSIISNGNVTINGATALGNIFATGTINLSQMGASGNVIYSKTKIVTSATISAIVFSGGDIQINSGSGSITGAVIAKGNCTNSGWPTIHYSASDIASKLANLKGTFFDPGGGSAALDASVFQGQSITAIGRIN
ncbi:MAG: hypothetical protein GXW96_07380 [Christensenellaceae bacterium]|nr:hypothetical protein [Christensenellaceae bacterium]